MAEEGAPQAEAVVSPRKVMRWQVIQASMQKDPGASSWTNVISSAKSAAAMARAAQEAAQMPPSIAELQKQQQQQQRQQQRAMKSAMLAAVAASPPRTQPRLVQQPPPGMPSGVQHLSDEVDLGSPLSAPPPQLGQAPTALPVLSSSAQPSPSCAVHHHQPQHHQLSPSAAGGVPPGPSAFDARLASLASMAQPPAQRVTAAPSGVAGSPPPGYAPHQGYGALAQQPPHYSQPLIGGPLGEFESDAQWKWAFKALEQRNRELLAENEAMKQRVFELSELSNRAAEALKSAVAAAEAKGYAAGAEGQRVGGGGGRGGGRGGGGGGPPHGRSSHSRRAAHVGFHDRSALEGEAGGSEGPSPRHHHHQQQQEEEAGVGRTRLPKIGIVRSASEGHELPQAPAGDMRLPRVSAAPGAASGVPRRRAPVASQRGGGGKFDFYTPPGMGSQRKHVGPSSRQLAWEYAQRSVPKPRQKSPRRLSDGEGGQGQGQPPQKGEAVVFMDDETVDFEGFLTAAAETSDRNLSDEELRARFDELHPDPSLGGKIHLQDYRLTLLFESLSKQCAKVLDLFRAMDTDESNSIDRREFRNGLKKLGFEYSDADIDIVFTHLDSDGGGSIDFVELNQKLRPKTCRMQVHKLRTSVELRRGASKQIALGGKRKKLQRGPNAPPIADQLQAILKANYLKVLDVFKMYDTNDDGTVDAREFADGLTALGYDAPREEFEELFREFDVDGSGSLDYYELHKQLRAGRRPTKRGAAARRRGQGGGGTPASSPRAKQSADADEAPSKVAGGEGKAKEPPPVQPAPLPAPGGAQQAEGGDGGGGAEPAKAEEASGEAKEAADGAKPSEPQVERPGSAGEADPPAAQEGAGGEAGEGGGEAGGGGGEGDAGAEAAADQEEAAKPEAEAEVAAEVAGAAEE